MPHLPFQCPHCLTEGAGFSGEHYHDVGGPLVASNLFHVFMVCGVCSKAVVAEIHGPGFGDWLRYNTATHIRLIQVFPKAPVLEAPPSVPDNIRSYYLQALDNHRRSHFDAAGTMFRKALDMALRRLHPGNNRQSIYQRIEALPTDLGFTPAMKEWAHEIRELGNDAAHEEDPFTAEESASLQAFTELFLTYAFTLPAMLAVRRADPTAEQ